MEESNTREEEVAVLSIRRWITPNPADDEQPLKVACPRERLEVLVRVCSSTAPLPALLVMVVKVLLPRRERWFEAELTEISGS